MKLEWLIERCEYLSALEIRFREMAELDAGESMAEFDSLVEIGDRLPIAEMLNDAKLPCCELYTSRFDYEKTVKAKPKDQPKIDGSVPKAHLSLVKCAKTRYIIYNQSRRKNC